MINVELIRNKVLDNAIQGKLINNNNQEKTPEVPEVDDYIVSNDISFEIPNNWIWVKIGWIMNIERGGSPRPIKSYLTNKEEGINWIKIGDVEKNGKYICNTKEKIKPEGISKSRKVYPGDFLLTNSMSFGRPYISKIEGCVHDGWLILRNVYGLFYYDYLYYLLSSRYVYNQFCKKASGATVENLNIDKVADAVVPLPPIKEQVRIVEKIENIFKLLELIEQKKKKYFCDLEVLKGKVVDLGIKGKLTEQLPENGNVEDLFKQIQSEKAKLIEEGKIKKEKTLSPITDSEIPFPIPDNWKWVRLGDISIKISSGNTPAGGKKSNVYVEQGYCFFREQNIYNDGIHEEGLVYITEELLNTRVNSTVLPKDILLNITGGSIGRCALIPDDFTKGSVNQHILIIRMVDPRLRFFVHSYLCSPQGQKYIKGNSVGDKDGFSATRCKNMPIPLPPLEEQDRIVTIINNFLHYIN